MKNINYLLKNVLGHNYNIKQYRSAYHRAVSYGTKQKFSTSNWAKSCIAILLLPIYFPFILKKHSSNTIIFGDSSSKESIKETRLSFLEYNKIKVNEPLFLYDEPKIYYCSLSVTTLLQIIHIWFYFLLATFKNYNNRYIKTHELYYSFLYTSSITLSQSDDLMVFGFCLYRPITYLTSLIVSEKKTTIDLSVSSSNSLLYAYNRYTFLPHVKLLLCTKCHEIELKYFEKIGWFKVKSSTLWSPEEVSQYNKITPTAPSYDIGVYSSGYWARIEGIIRASSIEDIKTYKYADNNLSMAFDKILDTAIQFSKQHDITLKVYLHPFERELIKKDIYPPYWHLLKTNNIAVDLSSRNSISTIYECKLGISLFSTITIDRWNLGLDALMFHLDIFKSLINPKALGPFSSNICRSNDDLENKLIEYFKK